jgi:phytoene dehydrogenase-like protein
MSERFDCIVVGGGHNGLACAAYLAHGGRRTLVLEARDSLGGMAAAREFHPGYTVPGLLHDTAGLRPSVVKELALEERHGLKRVERPDIFVPETAGGGLVIRGDVLEGALGDESAAFGRYRTFIERISPLVCRLLDHEPPELTAEKLTNVWEFITQGLAFRRLGRSTMNDMLRVPPMPVADWVDEFFERDLLKAATAAPAVWGTYMGPRSPGSAANLIFHECLQTTAIRGGPAALIAALVSACQTGGVTVRTGVRLEKICVEEGRVTGVQLPDGESIGAPVVVAACDPKQAVLSLLPPTQVAPKLESAISNVRTRGTAAKVHIALNQPLTFSGRDGQRFERVRTGESLNDLERAFDAVKYGRMSDRPILDICVPTVADAGLAPAGHEVVSVLAHFCPYDLEGGWTDSRRESLGTTVLDVLAAYAPDVRNNLVHVEVLTPLDLEREYSLPGGHIYHGEHALDQLLFMRPATVCASHRTPVEGLFLGSSGTHPGGGLTAGPGRLAAQSVLSQK